MSSGSQSVKMLITPRAPAQYRVGNNDEEGDKEGGSDDDILGCTLDEGAAEEDGDVLGVVDKISSEIGIENDTVSLNSNTPPTAIAFPSTVIL